LEHMVENKCTNSYEYRRCDGLLVNFSQSIQTRFLLVLSYKSFTVLCGNSFESSITVDEIFLSIENLKAFVCQRERKNSIHMKTFIEKYQAPLQRMTCQSPTHIIIGLKEYGYDLLH